jgi:hypothetical protein
MLLGIFIATSNRVRYDSIVLFVNDAIAHAIPVTSRALDNMLLDGRYWQ